MYTRHEKVYMKILDWMIDTCEFNRTSIITEMFNNSLSEELSRGDLDKNKIKFIIHNGAFIDDECIWKLDYLSKIYELDKDLFDRTIKSELAHDGGHPLFALSSPCNHIKKREMILRMIGLGCNIKHIDYGGKSLIMRILDDYKSCKKNYSYMLPHLSYNVDMNIIENIILLMEVGVDPFHTNHAGDTVIDYLLNIKSCYMYNMIILFKKNNKQDLFTWRILRFMLDDIEKREHCKKKFMEIDTHNYFIKDIKMIVCDYLSQVFI
jgi:hypothetical protein